MRPEFIAIIVVVLLISLFIGTYVLNKRTDIPKECLDLFIDDEKCQSCVNAACGIKQQIDKKKEGNA